MSEAGSLQQNKGSQQKDKRLIAGGKDVRRENYSSAEEPERTKLRPAGPKTSEDNKGPSMQTEGKERKAENLCDEGKGLPGGTKVLETQPKSPERKLETLAKQDQAEENATRSLLDGPKSSHGNANIQQGSKSNAKDKNGSHDQGGYFRGGNQTSPGRRQGGETVIHGDNEDLHVEEKEGSKLKEKMSFREGTKALGGDPVSSGGKGETLTDGEKSQRSLTGNKMSLKPNSRVVDTDNSNHVEWNNFRGGKKALETQSNNMDEESKAFINITNTIKQRTEIFHGDISHPARGRDRKKAAPSRYKRRRLEKNGDAICERPAPWRTPGVKNALMFLLLFQQFVRALSAGSPSNSTNGSRVYRFCCSNSANLTHDHLIFRLEMSAVCEYTAGKVSKYADNIYNVFLQNDTCAIMETSDSETKYYSMEQGEGKPCASVPYDLPKVLNIYQMINQTTNNVTNPVKTDDSGASYTLAIGLSIGLLVLLALVAFGFWYIKRSRKNNSTSVRNGVCQRYSAVTNGCPETLDNVKPSGKETANGV